MTALDMVENETVDAFGKPKIEFTHPFMKSKLTVYKLQENGFFYGIERDKGLLPNSLKGKFTTINAARKAIKRYFNTLKPSTAVKRDKTWEDNHKDK